MSVEAISRALNLAPVPADRAGQPSTACKFVLVGLANHAGPDGTGAFPSAATLVRYTGRSERTVRTCLARLDAAGIISPCDPGIVAARIKRADRRPKGWDLDLSLIRDDRTEAGLAALERQLPGLAARAAWPRGRTLAAQLTGCNHRTPPKRRDNRPDRVQPLHPASGTGRNQRTGGVQPAQPRRQQVHPNRPENHPENRPPPARVGARR